MNTPSPAAIDLVLIGGGHAHVHVLKMWAMRKLQKEYDEYDTDMVQVTLISPTYQTPYSGMLPGYLAGHYTHDEMHLDLAQLARFCGARFLPTAACGLTYNQETGGGWITTTDGRPPVRYDCVSIDIGSAPSTWKQSDESIDESSGTNQVEAIQETKRRTRDTDLPDTLAPRNHKPLVSVPSSNTSVVIPVKPIANFCQQYDAVIKAFQTRLTNSDTPDEPSYTIAIVGGGAGGIELALSLDYQLQALSSSGPKSYEIVVLTRASQIMETHNRRVRAIFERILTERQIRVVCRAHVQHVVDCVDGTTPTKRVVYQTGESPTSTSSLEKTLSTTPVDGAILVQACFWCVTAQAASWLRDATPLTLTESGNFVRVRDTHECVDHPGVFAAGDCCHMDDHPRPKAGVFAVRAGPILLDNLVRYCTGHVPLRSYTPQTSMLGLISTGNKYAVASRGNWLCLEGAWLWIVKDWIDRSWMAKYSTELPDLTEMMAQVAAKGSLPLASRKRKRPNSLLIRKGLDDNTSFAVDPMRCGGCGAKVGSTIVARVLEAVHVRQGQRAKRLGCAPPERIDHDDAAITLIPTKDAVQPVRAVIQTIDYFRELVNDPFTFGKIVAIHALSDMHAMGASASTALTLAVAPFAADESITESVLLHLLSGVSDVLQDEGIELVGGHTCEGHELACGLSVMGLATDPTALLRKRGGQIGDRIVLTKPLGTGALFAAEMRGKAKGDHVREALGYMLRSSNKASLVARRFAGVHACTDVTGFGLVGHLLEMLMANEGSDDNTARISAVLNIASMRFYQGGLAASAQGIYSTLQPQNARNRRAVSNHTEAASCFPVEYPLLFDPQTAGGLLFFVDSSKCDLFLAALRTDSVEAFVIGDVEPYTEIVREQPAVDETEVCTIGSGSAATGERVRILCS